MVYTTSTNDIRNALVQRYNRGLIRNGTVELQGVSFRADAHEIFPETRNAAYIEAEIEWYDTTSPFVDDLAKIYGKRVKIWDSVSDATGKVNSNYGALIYDTRHGCQYYRAKEALKKDPTSRQAVMIYQDKWMHQIAGRDFTCTNAVQYFLNGDHFDMLDCVVQMRSNDAIFGYNNDFAWQSRVLDRLAQDLTEELEYKIFPGSINWQVGSLHVYERHFPILEKWS